MVLRKFMLIAATLLALGVGLAIAPALAETRVALVIGNANYANVPHLGNPVNDAQTVASALRSVGFSTVTLQSDLDYSGMRQVLLAFSALASHADVAVVYYAGHGMEVGGVNYLIPIDAQIADANALSLEAVPLDSVLQAVQGARRLKLVVLDACRNNPFALHLSGSKRSIGRGLARVEPESDTLVLYAARDGTTADDGTTGHSPFASAFARDLAVPGLEIRLLFGKVRDDVLAATNQQQEPFVYGSLGGAPFYFLNPANTTPAQAALQPPPPQTDPAAFELAFWQSIQTSNDPSDFEAYLNRYPNGTFAGLARNRIAALNAAAKTSSSSPPSSQQKTASPPEQQLASNETPPPRVPQVTNPFEGVWQIKAIAAVFGGGDDIWLSKITFDSDKWHMSGTCLSGPVKNPQVEGNTIKFECTGSLVGYTFEGTLVSPTRIEGRWRNIMFSNTWSADRQ
jgi:hypothetical protein